MMVERTSYDTGGVSEQMAGRDPGSQTTLASQMRIAQRREKAVGLMLIAPLLVLMLVTFVFPIGLMLYRSVDNPIIADALPRTVQTLRDWRATALPDETAYAALAEDLRQASEAGLLGKLGARLNFEFPGATTAVSQTARLITSTEGLSGPYKDALIAARKEWGDISIWSTIKQLSPRWTDAYYLAAIDLERDDSGSIVAKPKQEAAYVSLFMRTIWVSAFVTFVCILLAYPIAYQIANQPASTANILLFLVLLPFWTSALVRTTAWIIILQRQGIINDLLVWSGLLANEDRVQMIYNMTGTLIAMIHVLLPFMVLPIYSVMKSISPEYVQAAQSLGGSPVNAWRRIYFPQTLPGLGAGCILVFVSAIGYYITPALVGGRTGRLISNFIAFHMQESLNWGLAAALGGLLLAGVLGLYFAYDRAFGLNRFKLG